MSNIKMKPTIYCIEKDDWIFGFIAKDISIRCGCPIEREPNGYCYIFSDPEGHSEFTSFIPVESIIIASDKRKIEEKFKV